MSEESAALERLVYELTLFSRHYLTTVRHRDTKHLDRSAYLILTRLKVESPLSLKEMAEAFRLDVSTINRQVAALLKQGLVERVPDPDGGIARKVQATDQGLDLLAADRAQTNSDVGKVVEEWTDTEVADLAARIRRFNVSIEDLEDNPWPRPTD